MSSWEPQDPRHLPSEGFPHGMQHPDSPALCAFWSRRRRGPVQAPGGGTAGSRNIVQGFAGRGPGLLKRDPLCLRQVDLEPQGSWR